MQPKEIIKYLYLQTRKAPLTGDEHETCAKLYQSITQEIDAQEAEALIEKKDKGADKKK